VTPTVSIVCVTHNRREHALRCLESCVSQTYPQLEIVVFVNPSGDGTEDAIAERFPELPQIRAHRNIGFFPALNLTIANTSGKYVMTVDDDARFVSNDAIAHLVAALESDPDLAAVTCNLEGPTERPITGGDRYVHVFTTGFTMMPRRAFTEWVGYYPDLFFRGGGETFMCSALWDSGKRVKRLEHVRMYHARTGDGRTQSLWQFHALRSQLLCAIMREPWFLIAPSLSSKMARSFARAAAERHLHIWAAACCSTLWHLRAALRLRKPISWTTQRLLWRLRRA
jgi:GT2 family glycosyltransferase